MTTATLRKEISVLKQRQAHLEQVVYRIIAPRRGGDNLEVRPEYLRKLRRISREMRAGKGVTVVRTRKELKQFFRGL